MAGHSALRSASNLGQRPNRLTIPRRSLPDALTVGGRYTEPGMITTAARTIESILLEHGFGVASLNTDMTQDHSPPFSGASTGFISLPFPPIPRPISFECSLAPTMAKRAQRLAAKAYWDLLRRLLTSNGQPAFLDRLDHDPEGGWCIHFSAAYPELVVAMHEVAGEENGPGDLSAFDAHDQVKDWLRRIENRVVCALSG